MRKHPHLLNRNGHYYFRLAVPVNLIALIGRKELTYSLKTKCYHEAKAKCAHVLVAARKLLDSAEQMKTLSQDEIKLYIGRYLKRHIDAFDQVIFDSDEFDRLIMNEPEKRLQRLYDARKEFLKIFNTPGADTSKARKSFRHTLEQDRKERLFAAEMLDSLDHFQVLGDEEAFKAICKENNINDNELSPRHKNVLKSAVQRLQREIESIRDQYQSMEVDIRINDTYLQDALVYAQDKDPVISLTEEEKTPISQAFADYIAQSTNKDKRAINKKQSSLDLWVEIIGDTPLGLIDKPKVRKFVEVLQALPSNRKKHYPDKTIEEIMELDIPDNDLMKNATINSHLSPLSAFMQKFAIRKYNLSNKENPFSGMYLEEQEDDEDLRDPFDERQLKGIFTSPIYKGCSGPKQNERYAVGTKVIKDSLYWVPLIALYSGARLNEILSLYVADIYQVADVWVFDINDEGDDKKVKTKKSKRIIPVHPKIIEMGFLEYVEATKKKKKKRLFYDAEISSDGTYSNRFSKKFSNMLVRFELKTDKTAFHSFRHNVIDVFRYSDKVDEETSNAITGHKSEGTRARYGGKRNREQLKKHVPKLAKAMQHLEYPFLDKILSC